MGGLGRWKAENINARWFRFSRFSARPGEVWRSLLETVYLVHILEDLFCFPFQSELTEATEEALRAPSTTPDAAGPSFTSLVNEVLTAAVSGDDKLRDACRERIKSEGIKPPHLLTHARENSGQLLAQVMVISGLMWLQFKIHLCPGSTDFYIFSGVLSVWTCEQARGDWFVYHSDVLVSPRQGSVPESASSE